MQYSGNFNLNDVNESATGFSEDDNQRIKDFAKVSLHQEGLSEILLNGQMWVAKIARLNSRDKASAKLFIATPKAKIFASPKQLLLNELMISWLIIVIFIPLTWFFAGVIVRPIHRLVKNTHKLAGLQFSQVSTGNSFIKELNELEQDMHEVSHSLQNTFTIINMLAKEKNINVLAENICSQACEMLNADAAFIFLTDKKSTGIVTPFFAWGDKQVLDIKQFSEIHLYQQQVEQVEPFLRGEVQFTKLKQTLKDSLIATGIYQQDNEVNALILPLVDREGQISGLLGFSFSREFSLFEREQYIGVASALAKFIAVAIEGSEIFENQKQLIKSFFRVMADSIDTKSPYTGAHCQRVPILTMMLAEQEIQSKHANLNDFSLTDEQRYELKTAAWLHDCGKVTTPENVVDKATKLESIYNRIHEIRMRFEVLWRDAHIHSLKKLLPGKRQR